MLREKRRIAGWLMCAAVGVLVGAFPASASAAALPDGRAYELVSPALKNGSDVMADAARTRSAASGDAVGFSSLAPFGDARGSGIATDYISERTRDSGTSGWVTHAIIPQVNPLTISEILGSKDTTYQGEFADDLSSGVLSTYTPLGGDPNVALSSNLYLRQDALSAGPGTYTLLSSCPACSSPLTDNPLVPYRPIVADSTPDLGHIIFEATRDLTPDAPPYAPFPLSLCNDNPILAFVGCSPRLYEWDHGVLRLAGILPDGTAAPASIAGNGALQATYTLNTISRDGSKIFFTVPADPSDPSSTTGNVYMRANHASTVQLNASERTDCADHSPCVGVPEPDPAGQQAAKFVTASTDGRKVFFETSEQLTDTLGGNLYVYDTTLPASDPNRLAHVYVDEQPADGSGDPTTIFGASTDGSYLYFATSNAILAGQPHLPSSSDGIYVWHNGAIAFIGALNFQGETINAQGSPWSVHQLASRVSPDGRTLLFTSFSGVGLTGYNHGNTCGTFQNVPCAELYLYKADTASLACISCNPTGAPATSDATFSPRIATGSAPTSTHLTHALSSDGSRVFFETGERLLSGQDANGKHTDVYEWTAVGTQDCTASSPGYTASTHGCLSLITTGNSTDDSHFLDASPSGQDVFFSTNQRLVGWDTDNDYDLYDARMGGGFPDPTPATPECLGEECQGLITTPPLGSAPPTSTDIHGSGNVPTATHKNKPAAKKCAEGKVRKRVRGKVKCVKKHKVRTKAHKSKAKARGPRTVHRRTK